MSIYKDDKEAADALAQKYKALKSEIAKVIVGQQDVVGKLVIALFCKCIPGMNSSRAFELAWRIDHEGQATVYSGERKAAEEIGKKLAAGGLRVGVQ